MTDEERFKIDIMIVNEWTTNRTCTEIEDLFIRLEEYDLNKNTDFWEKLREALAGNNELLDEQLQAYIYKPVLAANGFWWYDKKNWTSV